MFTQPFTIAQRQKATAILRSMKKTHSDMRRRYRAGDRRQRDLAREFRVVASDFADTLRAKDARVNVKRLNALLARSNAVAIEYIVRQIGLPGSSDDD